MLKGLIEVEPVEYKKKGITVWYYESISTHRLSWIPQALEEDLNNLAKNGKWKVISPKEGVYHLQFTTKDLKTKPLLIIMENDKLYTTEDVWNTLDHIYIRHQASILIGLLKKLHLVQHPRTRYFSYEKYGESIKEDIPSEDNPVIPWKDEK